jgi:hypothetical protein
MSGGSGLRFAESISDAVDSCNGSVTRPGGVGNAKKFAVSAFVYGDETKLLQTDHAGFLSCWGFQEGR